METVRHLNPKSCDRITDLVGYTGFDMSQTAPKIQEIAVLAKKNPAFAKYTLNSLLYSIERDAIHKHFNFVLRGLPHSAPLRSTGVEEPIGYAHVRDTLADFGTFTNLKIIRGTVYVKFEDPSSCAHCDQTLNNMQIGTHIVKTAIFSQ
jgi:hypothetical protein